MATGRSGEPRTRGGGRRAVDDLIRIRVRLTPRAGVDRVDRVSDGVLHCRVAASPVEGTANAALLRLLAHELGVPPTSLRLVSGERGRDKLVALPASARSTVAARWPGLADRAAGRRMINPGAG